MDNDKYASLSGCSVFFGGGVIQTLFSFSNGNHAFEDLRLVFCLTGFMLLGERGEYTFGTRCRDAESSASPLLLLLRGMGCGYVGLLYWL